MIYFKPQLWPTVLMLMALVGTMESTTLCHALYRLRTPESLVHLLMFTVRYIDVLHQEYLRLRTAMKARGFRPQNSRHRNNIKGKFQTKNNSLQAS